MAYKALYREWRPLSFNDVVEQEHVTRTLKKSVMANRIAHAYLFTGTRGTGKTSMALIFARAINCLDPKNGNPCNKCSNCTGILNHTILDVIEIDAASNNSVENIRTIREEVMYTPSVAKFKVYIIDEVHMLSPGAFNALLKTLEEPPSHIVFILATTEPHKLPATILSRCQRYDFHRITVEGINQRLNKIIGTSGVILEEKASKMISRIADGALRNAISLLDQCLALDEKTITVKDVLECAGIPNDLAMEKLALAIFEKNISKVLEITGKIIMEGKSPSQLLQSILYYYRNLLICKSVTQPEEYIECTLDDLQRMKRLVSQIETNLLTYIIKELSVADALLKRISQPKTYLEVVLINITTMNLSQLEDTSLLERITSLERKVNNLKQIQVAPKELPPVVIKKEKPKEKQKSNIQKNIETLDFSQVIKVLVDDNKVDVYPYLLGSKVIINGEELQVFVTSKFNKNMILDSKDNLKTLIKAIKLVTGNQYIVHLKVETDEIDTNTFEDNTLRAAKELGVTVNFED